MELERRGLTPLEVAAIKGRPTHERSRVNQAVLARAYSQVADLLRAGVPLLRALRLLGRGASAPGLAAVFTEVAQRVEQGDDLADAMADQPGVFRPIHVAMVRAGERGAFLETALARLAGFVQGQVELRQRVIGALIYPAVIVGAGVLILGALFVFFVPRFEERFRGIELSWPTLVVMGMSDLLVNNWPALLVVLGGVCGGAVYTLRSPVWRARAAALLARAPVVGALLRALAVARFTRVLGTLLESGVTMLQSLRIAKGAAGLPAMEEAIDAAAEAVTRGDALTAPLADSGLFGEDVIEMIEVAESANNLGAVLPSIASTLEQRVSRRLDVAVKLIEPVTILGIGVTIAFVAIGLLLPMFKLASGQGLG